MLSCFCFIFSRAFMMKTNNNFGFDVNTFEWLVSDLSFCTSLKDYSSSVSKQFLFDLIHNIPYIPWKYKNPSKTAEQIWIILACQFYGMKIKKSFHIWLWNVEVCCMFILDASLRTFSFFSFWFYHMLSKSTISRNEMFLICYFGQYLLIKWIVVFNAKYIWSCLYLQSSHRFPHFFHQFWSSFFLDH